jgi:protein-disulfide isomerase
MSKLSVPVSSEDHIQGDSTAGCVLVEYGDYECPSCGQAYPIVKRLQKHFGDRLSFVFRNFPLSQIHPWAEAAAEAAEYSASHGKFWEMHDRLYENQDSLSEALFVKLAAELGLPSAELTTAVAEQTYLGRIQGEFDGGVRSGVNGTPTFFMNGQRYNGSYDFASMSDAIDRALKAGSSNG